MAEERAGAIIGRNVRRLRDGGLWTREELAAKAGVARQTIAHLELGTSGRPRRGTIEKIAGALDVPIETLLAGTDGETPKAEAPRSSEEERRRVQLEEVRHGYRETREGVEDYVVRWERWLETGGIPEEAVREFLVAARAWYPALRDLLRSELTEISIVLGLEPSPMLANEAKAESALLPLVDRYGRLGQRLTEVWAERHPEEEAPVDFAARRDDLLSRTA